MKTISIPGFIYAEQPENWRHGDANVVDNILYRFSVYGNLEGVKGCGVLICPHTITFEQSEKFDPRSKLIADLQAKEKTLNAEFSARVTDIRRQISELQALEFTA